MLHKHLAPEGTPDSNAAVAACKHRACSFCRALTWVVDEQGVESLSRYILVLGSQIELDHICTVECALRDCRLYRHYSVGGMQYLTRA